MEVSENIKNISMDLSCDENTNDEDQYLTFVLNNETLAICITCIKEIIEFHDVTTIPMMPDAMLGVINLRGGVVPVIDLSSIFRRWKTTINPRSCIVIAEVISENNSCQNIGIVVDAVNEVLEIHHSEIKAAPSFGNGIKTDYLYGIANIKDHFVPILNLTKIISSNEMDVLSNIAVENS